MKRNLSQLTLIGRKTFEQARFGAATRVVFGAACALFLYTHHDAAWSVTLSVVTPVTGCTNLLQVDFHGS
jgi:hypothetical protein